MKRTIIYITLISAFTIIGILSCKKNFLEFTPQDGSFTDATRWQTAADFELGVIGTYAFLQERGDKMNIFMAGMVSQDVVPIDETPIDLNVLLTPGNGDVAALWRRLYYISSNANIVLDRLETAPAAVTADDKKRISAQVKFLRGFAYFNLAQAFGSVPLITTVFDPSQLKMSCTPEAQVWDQVIADFTAAAADLPEANDWGAEKGRASKGSALGYLAQAYMYKKDWAKARKAHQDLMGLTKPSYRLLGNVRSVFTYNGKNTDESVFEVQYRKVPNAQFQWGTTPNNGHLLNESTAPRSIGADFAAFGGWGQWLLNKKFADAFDPNDDRRKELVKLPGESYKGELMSSTLTIPRNIVQPNSAFATKYWLGPSVDYLEGQNLPYLRFAEVLLDHAEVLFELGNAPEAYKNLNLVRQRAKLGDKPVSTNKETFFTDLTNERRFELFMEPGIWWHLVRSGRAEKFLLDNHRVVMKSQWKHYPIPQSELDQNENLCKNGY